MRRRKANFHKVVRKYAARAGANADIGPYERSARLRHEAYSAFFDSLSPDTLCPGFLHFFATWRHFIRKKALTPDSVGAFTVRDYFRQTAARRKSRQGRSPAPDTVHAERAASWTGMRSSRDFQSWISARRFFCIADTASCCARASARSAVC